MFGEHRRPSPDSDFLEQSISILLDGISSKNP